jgi:hypothetical protein
MTEQENRIIEELRKNWHEWDFDEKMLFILSKIKEAEDRKVEEIVEKIENKISGKTGSDCNKILQDIINSLKQ